MSTLSVCTSCIKEDSYRWTGFSTTKWHREKIVLAVFLVRWRLYKMVLGFFAVSVRPWKHIFGWKCQSGSGFKRSKTVDKHYHFVAHEVPRVYGHTILSAGELVPLPFSWTKDWFTTKWTTWTHGPHPWNGKEGVQSSISCGRRRGFCTLRKVSKTRELCSSCKNYG